MLAGNHAGNTAYFHSLVTFKPAYRQQPDEQQYLQVLQLVCQGALRFDSEDAAAAYRQKQRGGCPAMVSIDKGSVIHSSGQVSIGGGSNCPSSISQLGAYLGGPDQHQTPEYCRLSAVLGALEGMPACLQTLGNAEVRLHAGSIISTATVSSACCCNRFVPSWVLHITCCNACGHRKLCCCRVL